MRRTLRKTVLFAATATVALGTLTAVSGSADARVPAKAPHFTSTFTHSGDYFYLRVQENGKYAGQAVWSPDPHDGDPHDALNALDALPDGYFITAHLSSGRVASTAGHPAFYNSPWVTGTLKKHYVYTLGLCVQNNSGFRYCTPTHAFVA